MNRRRGRPCSDSVDDEAIAKTCHQLVCWGFSLRGEAFSAVGALAAKILRRGLGPDRIEQIYEQWCRQTSQRPPVQYAKASRRRRIPNKTASLDDLACTLMKSAGEWPIDPNDVFVSFGDPELTATAHASSQRSRLTWSGR